MSSETPEAPRPAIPALTPDPPTSPDTPPAHQPEVDLNYFHMPLTDLRDHASRLGAMSARRPRVSAHEGDTGYELALVEQILDFRQSSAPSGADRSEGPGEAEPAPVPLGEPGSSGA